MTCNHAPDSTFVVAFRLNAPTHARIHDTGYPQRRARASSDIQAGSNPGRHGTAEECSPGGLHPSASALLARLPCIREGGHRPGQIFLLLEFACCFVPGVSAFRDDPFHLLVWVSETDGGPGGHFLARATGRANRQTSPWAYPPALKLPGDSPAQAFAWR